MKIPIQQLDKHLKQSYPVYLFSGENSHFIAEGIKKLLRHLSISSPLRFYIENKTFDWDSLSLQASHPSLFDDKRLILLKLSISLDKTQQTRLLDIIDHAQDTLFIIETNKLTQAQLKQPWLQWIERYGRHFHSPLLTPEEAVNWIKAQMKEKGLSTSEKGYELIALSTEGNMLALAQTLAQLSLLFQEQEEEIPLPSLEACLSKQAHYTIYQCVDEAFNQNTERMLIILNSLSVSSTEPALLLWACLNTLRTVCSMQFDLKQGKSLPTLLKQYHVWHSKSDGITRTLQSHSLAYCYTLLQSAKEVDESIKGLNHKDAWSSLKNLLLAISSPQHLCSIT